MSGASNSTLAKETPPSDSPVPERMRDVMSGRTVAHEGQYEVVQSVRSGRRDEVERRRYVLSASVLRTLEHFASASWCPSCSSLPVGPLLCRACFLFFFLGGGGRVQRPRNRGRREHQARASGWTYGSYI